MQPLSRIQLPEIEAVINRVSSVQVPLGNRTIETQNS